MEGQEYDMCRTLEYFDAILVSADDIQLGLAAVPFGYGARCVDCVAGIYRAYPVQHLRAVHDVHLIRFQVVAERSRNNGGGQHAVYWRLSEDGARRDFGVEVHGLHIAAEFAELADMLFGESILERNYIADSYHFFYLLEVRYRNENIVSCFSEKMV